jgi:hypothetical protein
MTDDGFAVDWDGCTLFARSRAIREADPLVRDGTTATGGCPGHR